MGLRPFDALHLSSAVEAEADMFCTPDDPLLRRGKEAETERKQNAHECSPRSRS